MKSQSVLNLSKIEKIPSRKMPLLDQNTSLRSLETMKASINDLKTTNFNTIEPSRSMRTFMPTQPPSNRNNDNKSMLLLDSIDPVKCK